jgi:penicillin G amidase
MKIVKRLLLAVLLLLIVLGVGGWIYLHTKKPTLNAELSLPELQAPVEVLYDTYGIPHIYAQNEADLYYALGYVHAQDRLFQMELVRRLAGGRLSEVFGEAALETDRFFRTLSFREAAEKSVAAHFKDNDAPHIVAANAYLRGVNQYLTQGDTPLEFELLGIPKEPFTAVDMMMVSGYMGFTFAEAFRAEPLMTMIHEKYGPEYLNDLVIRWSEKAPKIPVRKTALPDSLIGLANKVTDLESQLPMAPFHGSNGWVIAPFKTRSKGVILSNDTHIAFAQPSTWYEAHLECPGFRFYGNFLALVPVGILGHNDAAGWGITMFENDDVDFYREKANPQDKAQVWVNDHWENLRVRDEIIRIKDQEEVHLTVRYSRHGPIINDAMNDWKGQNEPVSLWWTYYQFPDQSLKAFYDLAHARNVSQAAQAVSLIHAPGLNIMFGDREGNIAWWAAGKLVKRPAHVQSFLLLDGASGQDEPLGWYDFAQNPQNLNPASGVLYSANNQPDDMGYGLYPGYYVPGNRAQRIQELLFTDKADWTPEQVRSVINDTQSPTYPALLAQVLPLIEADSTVDKNNLNVARCLTRLREWKGNHDKEEVAPVIFYKFLYHFYALTFRDELGDAAFKAFLNSHTIKRTLPELAGRDTSRWWDNIRTPDVRETRAFVCTEAFKRTVADLEAQLGNEVSEWKWGRVHTLEHGHPLGRQKPLDKLFNVGPLAVNGGKEVINNLDFPLDSTGLYKVSYGPALRRIVDLSNPENGTSINPTGQSGNRMSPHYQDQAQLFVDEKSRPEWMNRQDIERVRTARLVLKPSVQ